MRRAFAALCLLSACSDGGADGQSAAAPPDLETAAIQRGLVRDPGDVDPIGLYARETDRMCIVPGAGGYRIGAFVDYGEGMSCAGSGKAARSSNGLTVELKSRTGATCRFEARFDGERITFPPALPEACARFCSARASFAALEVERLSTSSAEATALRTANGTRLCGD